MPQILDLHQTGRQHGPEIQAFQQICTESGITCGTPDDLFAFPWQLSRDASFESAVAAYVRHLQTPGPLRHTFSEILSILLLAIGGPSAAALGVETHSSASLLTSFLVALGGWSSADLEQATTLEDHIRDELAREPLPGHARSDPDPRPLADAPFTPDIPPSTDTLHLLDLIARLEGSNLELRQKLDVMDERIRRMEPHSGSAAPFDPSETSSPEPAVNLLHRHAPPPFDEDIPRVPSPPSPTGHNDLPPTATPNPRPLTRLLTEEEHRADQRRISAPLRRRRLVRSAIFGAVLLSAGGGILYNALVHRRSAGGDASHQKSSSTSTSTDPLTGLPAPGASHTGHPGDGPLTSAPSAENAGTTSIDAAPDPAPSHVTIYSAPAEVTPPISPGHASPHPSRLAPVPGSSGSTPRTAHANSPATGRAGDLAPVFVPAKVMAAHLLSSRPPSYPHLANLSGLAGIVVLKATISPQGNVEHVEPVDGHYLLRGAAANAVRTWRYRPYLVNGRPVAVDTLVTINFALRR